MRKKKQSKSRVLDAQKLRAELRNVSAKLLQVYPRFRDEVRGYNDLVLKYWEEAEKTKVNVRSTQKHRRPLTSCETIARVFRKLIEQGLIEVPIWLRDRRIKEIIHREVLPRM